MPDTTPTKDDLLTALAGERRFWSALVAAVEGAGLMDRPGTNNAAWSFKDMTVHLNGWREMSLARLDAALRGEGEPIRPWVGNLEDGPDTDTINAWFDARGKARPAAVVLAETVAQFDAMDAAITVMPTDALLTSGYFAWWPTLPVGPAVLGYSFYHLHGDHEPDIRAWFRRETGTELHLPPAPSMFGYAE